MNSARLTRNDKAAGGPADELQRKNKKHKRRKKKFKSSESGPSRDSA
jgi:hypothetical protein